MGWEEPLGLGLDRGASSFATVPFSSCPAWELALPNEAPEGTLSPRDQRVFRLQCVNPGAEPCAFPGTVLGHSWNVLGKLA